jgi:hypothetical protein
MIRRTFSSILPLVLASFAPLAFAAAQAPAPNAPPEPADMKPIFNGKDLTGWDGNTKLWTVKDGVITGQSTRENPCKSNTFLIYTGDNAKQAAQVGDFELRLSYRIHGGNSGVQYRAKHLVGHKDNAWVVSGYQAEIADLPGKDGFLYEEKGPGRGGINGKKGYLAWVGDKVEIGEDGVSKVVGKLGEHDAIAAACKKGEWNDYIIIARGNHIQQYINGVQTVDVIDNDPKHRAMSGIIALQMHAGPPMTVEFKDVRLKEYK